MNRKLKALGLALFAVLAMGAMSASVASAGDFHSEVAHTTISGSQEGEDKFTVNAGTVTCQEATYAGTSVGKGTATEGKPEDPPFTTTTVKVIPTYSKCSAFGFINTTIDTNGCEYEFSGDNLNVNIICPEGKSIVVTAFNCEVTVGSQTTNGGITYDNKGTGSSRDVEVTVNITGISYIQHSKSFPGCSANGTLPRNDGKYTGAATVRGFDTAGGQVGIWRS